MADYRKAVKRYLKDKMEKVGEKVDQGVNFTSGVSESFMSNKLSPYLSSGATKKDKDWEDPVEPSRRAGERLGIELRNRLWECKDGV